MVLINFVAYAAATLYVYLLNQPLAPKVMFPIGTTVAAVMALQCIAYDKRRSRRHLFLGRLLLATGALVFAATIGLYYPYATGAFLGWMAAMLWFGYQIPQVLDFHRRQCVKGYSMATNLLLMVGSTAETIAAIGLGLPPQTLCNGVRSIVFGFIFVYQFSLHHDEPWYRWLAAE
jgi:hypothetical protein